MSPRTIPMDDRLYGYVTSTMLPDDPVAKALRERTATLPQAGMQISPEQGVFLQMLIRLIGARRALEVGTFTGYSALMTARALPADGMLICCDVSREWTDIGRQAWQAAGVAEKIDLRIGPAIDTLGALIDAGQAGQFDFAFIDADKGGYDAYYEACLILVRPGGLIAVDNVLWGGSVADPDNSKPDTLAIRAINAKIFKDPRVDPCLVPIGDGLTLARRKG